MIAPWSSHAGTEPPAALFTDLDGTLTTGGVVEPSTYAALVAVHRAGIPVVVVTGRPAGWAQAIAETWPVAATVAENGAVLFSPRRRYTLDEDDIAGLRERMFAAVDDVRAEIPAARLSEDSAYRDVDLAFDWNEHARLPIADADRIVDMLRARELAASRSSVHVNFGPRGIDKLVACRVVVEDVLGGDADDLSSYVYVGDSLNDATMFGAFGVTVGVANVAKVLDQLPSRPQYVTDAEEGAGFEEVAARLTAI